MKNLVLCLMMVFMVACGSEQVCDCLEQEEFDFFAEYYSVCSEACQLAVSLIHNCGHDGVSVLRCNNNFWDHGYSNDDCRNILYCYERIQLLPHCQWADNFTEDVPSYASSCPY